MSKSADGVYTRPDREGYWISWNDAQGRRRYRKTNAQTLTQALQRALQSLYVSSRPRYLASLRQEKKHWLKSRRVIYRIKKHASVRQVIYAKKALLRRI